MLNLSDKELDRMSREAAQGYDPGDLVGSRGWDKLEVHLDRDLGRVSLNPMRGFRRFPFLYAPAFLLLLGVSFYFLRPGKSKKAEPPGGPPLTVVHSTAAPGDGTTGKTTDSKSNDLSSTKNSEHNANSTQNQDKKAATVQYPASGGQPVVGQPANVTPSAASPATHSLAGAPGAAIHPFTNPSAAVSSTGHLPHSLNLDPKRLPTAESSTSRTGNKGIHLEGNNNNGTEYTARRPDDASTDLVHTGRGTGGRHSQRGDSRDGNKTLQDGGSNIAGASGAPTNTPGTATPGPVVGSQLMVSGQRAPRELVLSPVRRAKSVKQPARVSDAGLKTATALDGPIQIKKKGVLNVNRALHFGLSVAPDFSSVSSMAGDKPGSTIGLTVDYQFANRWYLGSGLLLSRKNYAARAEDFHAPPDYYRNNNIHNLDFVKGSLNMVEIPLNLRYDFSVAGNTVFFASVGVSSYLYGNENCNYYYNFYGREISQGFKYPSAGKENYLFSAANLSVGVEAGISNSLSILVAPYMKIPTRNIGFGQVQMNSVGINFALKFAPVISNKRR